MRDVLNIFEKMKMDRFCGILGPVFKSPYDATAPTGLEMCLPKEEADFVGAFEH